MYEDSVLRGTGQMWKFYVATLLLVPGTVAFVFGLGALFLGYLGVIVAASGAAAALIALVFAALAIRCPSCGAHWYWLALQESHSGWTRRFVQQNSCPKCQFRLPSHGA